MRGWGAVMDTWGQELRNANASKVPRQGLVEVGAKPHWKKDWVHLLGLATKHERLDSAWSP